jgi:hypothetical protein
MNKVKKATPQWHARAVFFSRYMDVLEETGVPLRPHLVEVRMSKDFARKFINECRSAGTRISRSVCGEAFAVHLSTETAFGFTVDLDRPGEMFQLRIVK